MKLKTQIRYWIWGLAENMDWQNRPPRKLWKWLLRRYDKYFGYRCENPEDKPFDYYPHAKSPQSPREDISSKRKG